MDKIRKFWEFSVHTYGLSGVSDACLTLQNRYGADVNMLLYCCWAGRIFGKLDEESFQRASRFSRSWTSNVVSPMRSVRTWMKLDTAESKHAPPSMHAELRNKVKSIELEAEKLQQSVLESSLPKMPDGQMRNVLNQPDCAAANLRRYCQSEAMPIETSSAELLAIILTASMPSITRESAMTLLLPEN